MMKSYLTEQNIAFTEINVRNNKAARQKLVETTQQMGVPQTQINGKWVL